MQINFITVDEYLVLMKKLESIEKKVDSLNEGIGSKSLHNIKEACELLKVSKRTLQKYRDEGILSFSQIKNKIYFRSEDLEKFILQNHVG